MQNHVISNFKKNELKKWRVVLLRMSQRFCGCFEKHLMGKHKENSRTVYNLFDHWNMTLSSDFCHLKTLLATRLVFHLCWRWQPVAHAPFQQPWNAAVLKRSWPRTSEDLLALLSGACHLVSHCVAQQLDSNNSVDLPRGLSVVTDKNVSQLEFWLS